MSAATIDRYLAPAKARDQISGVSTTTPSPLLRNSIKVRRAGDEVEDEPGFFEGDTVAHCGPTLKGEFARTLNLTDVHTGWVFTRTVRNNANTHILGALKAGVHEIPYEVTGLDVDNGTEFLNKAVIKWAAQMEIFFTRSRPYKKNDQATIEVGWPEGVSPSGSHRSVREPLSSYGSCHLDHQTAGTAVVQAQCAKYRGYASATRRHAWWTSRRPLNRRYFLRTQRIR
ncbi:integrase catalytic domain-containing protein [Candidatus Mycobacterium methanotrophicum]|uniref:Transposase family protein n=1 Tax=Candidatus Mycobacterium methanotrophicum TaxID=2943498 RepID=A0ABY4QTX7_9MYCO|nr:transposase family protein [Candidatus Mycobacterium methanotrophicum]UQX13651.1 transposase family protein [Candidatus Mycobacterium methanotrophicum]